MELPAESEATAASVRDIRGNLSAARSAGTVAQQLPKISREIDGRRRENRKINAQTPSIEMLGGFEGERRRVRRELYRLNKNLSGRMYELERYMAHLNDLAKSWDQTFAVAKQSSAPPEVLGRIENITSDIRQAREAVEKQRSRALTMQTRVGVQDSRVANVLTSIDHAREGALDRLFLPDNPPIWTPSMRSPSAEDLQRESLSSFSRQWDALRTYADKQAVRFVLGIAVSFPSVVLSAGPFAALGTASRHQPLLRRRIRRVLQSLGLVLWLLALLQRLLLRARIVSALSEFLAAKLSFGSIEISPGGVLAFIVTVWAAFLVSRFVRCLLDEDVYPRVSLKCGLAYAISNTLYYLILMIGFFLAVAALGLDMTRVTILAGAFSAG